MSPAPSFDYYDDGLVHAHEWSRNTPPGGHHADHRRGQAPSREEAATHERAR